MHERRGGRKKGSKNKITLERQMRSVQVAARHQGKEGEAPQLGKDVIDYFMAIATRYAKAYEPSDNDLSYSPDPAVQDMRDWKRNQFKGWARLAVSWAADLAPYQSPTYRAISISHKDEIEEDRGTTVIHTIEDLKAQLLLHGVSPDQLGRALLEQEQQMLEHENYGSDSEPESPERD